MRGFRTKFLEDEKNIDIVMDIPMPPQDKRKNERGFIQIGKNARNECKTLTCRSERREGSARCQACADKYYAETIIKQYPDSSAK